MDPVSSAASVIREMAGVVGGIYSAAVTHSVGEAEFATRIQLWHGDLCTYAEAIENARWNDATALYASIVIHIIIAMGHHLKRLGVRKIEKKPALWERWSRSIVARSRDTKRSPAVTSIARATPDTKCSPVPEKSSVERDSKFLPATDEAKRESQRVKPSQPARTKSGEKGHLTEQSDHTEDVIYRLPRTGLAAKVKSFDELYVKFRAAVDEMLKKMESASIPVTRSYRRQKRKEKHGMAFKTSKSRGKTDMVSVDVADAEAMVKVRRERRPRPSQAEAQAQLDAKLENKLGAERPSGEEGVEAPSFTLRTGVEMRGGGEIRRVFSPAESIDVVEITRPDTVDEGDAFDSNDDAVEETQDAVDQLSSVVNDLKFE